MIMFHCSALKKKFKDKMAEFQVGFMYMFQESPFSRFLNLKFLNMFPDPKRIHPSRVPGSGGKACLYRFSFVTCYA